MVTLLKILISVVLLAIAAFIYKYIYKLFKTINFYKAQGVRIMPGARRPLLGNLVEFSSYPEACDQSEEALPTVFKWAEETYFD